MALRMKEATHAGISRATRLYRRTERMKYAQMLVEGPQAVRELFTYAPALVRDFYVSEDALERHPEICESAAVAHTWTHPLPPQEHHELFPDAQGLLAVADMPKEPDIRQALQNCSLAVATVAINDPGNMGTIVRTADAAGAGVVLAGKGSAEVSAPKVLRSSAGSLFHLPVLTGLDVSEIIEAAHTAGFTVLALDARGQWELKSLIEAAGEAKLLGRRPDCPDLSRPILWLLGNEAHGFAGVDLRQVDATVSIPILGKAESLNVATAGAVALYSTALAR